MAGSFATRYGLHLSRLILLRAPLSLGFRSVKRHPTHAAERWANISTVSERGKIDKSYLLEEETVPGYRPENYYPVELGEVFRDRYKTVAKLGYESASTVWLCRDLLKENQYVALKVYINCSKEHRELPAYNHINSLQSGHEGRKRIRALLESFELDGPHGKHVCLVHQALGVDFSELKEMDPDGLFSVPLIRQTMRPILTALQFLHDEAHVVHTDLQPSNILMGVHDNHAFARVEQQGLDGPLPRKELGDRKIYLSQPMPLTKGVPCLSDLSEARFGKSEYTGGIMPDVYRAPEVILDMPWSYPVDIWNFGMVLWDLFEPRRVFTPRNADGQYSERVHLAQMVAIMGPPPLEFLQRSKKSREFWDEDGEWKNDPPIPEYSLETAEKRLEGEEKIQFLSFMRKMLKWKPEERGDCHDVFWDEWLLADLIESGEVVRD